MIKKQKIFKTAPRLFKKGWPMARVVACTALLAILVFCGNASADPAKYKPNSAWDLSYVLPPSPAIGDLYGFLGVGQPSVIKPGGAGLVLKSRGAGQMPGWETENVSGTVAIANGGTGTTTQQGAINALAGATTSAQYLRGNGTNVSMSAIQAGDVPTLNQSTTGNAATATALAANPADCGAGQYAIMIGANGDLTCATLPAATSSALGYRSTNQNIDTTTNTKVLFNAEEHDAGNEFDLSTGRFTATNAGTYLIAGCGYMVLIEVGKLFNVQLFRNGALLTNVLTYGSSADNHSICTSIVRTLAASDYIEMWVYHNNASTPKVLSGAATGGIDTHISIQRLY